MAGDVGTIPRQLHSPPTAITRRTSHPSISCRIVYVSRVDDLPWPMRTVRSIYVCQTFSSIFPDFWLFLIVFLRFLCFSTNCSRACIESYFCQSLVLQKHSVSHSIAQFLYMIFAGFCSQKRIENRKREPRINT